MEVDRLAAHGELGAVHAGQVEQVTDEPLQPARLEADDARRLIGAERAVGEALGVAADRCQRRLQLVAHREQEVALGLARGGQLLGHLVERHRERCELARAAGGQRLMPLVGCESARGVGHPPDRAHDRAGDEERDGRREQDPDEPRQQQVAEERPPRRRPRAGRAKEDQPEVRQGAVGVELPDAEVGRLTVARTIHVRHERCEVRTWLDEDPHAARQRVLRLVVDVLPALEREVVGAPRQARRLRPIDLPASEHRTDRDRQDQRERERGQRRREQPSAEAAHNRPAVTAASPCSRCRAASGSGPAGRACGATARRERPRCGCRRGTPAPTRGRAARRARRRRPYWP